MGIPVTPSVPCFFAFAVLAAKDLSALSSGPMHSTASWCLANQPGTCPYLLICTHRCQGLRLSHRNHHHLSLVLYSHQNILSDLYFTEQNHRPSPSRRRRRGATLSCTIQFCYRSHVLQPTNPFQCQSSTEANSVEFIAAHLLHRTALGFQILVFLGFCSDHHARHLNRVAVRQVHTPIIPNHPIPIRPRTYGTLSSLGLAFKVKNTPP